MEQITLVYALTLTQAAIDVIIAIVLYAYYRVHARQFLALWCMSWSALAIYHACAAALGLLRLPHDSASGLVLSSAANAVGWAAPLALAFGVTEFTRGLAIPRRRITVGIALALLVGVIVVVASCRLDMGWRYFLRPGLRSLFAGLVLIAVGIIIARSRGGSRLTVAHGFVIAGFFTYGGQGLHYAFITVRFLSGNGLPDHLIAVGLVDVVLQTALGFAMVAWFLETERRHSRRLEMRLEAAGRLEALGRLAAGMAHDFNNVLTTIIGNADLIRLEAEREAPDRVEIDEAAAAVSAVARRAGALVRQLLTAARGGEGTVRIIDAGDVVSELGPLLDHFMPAGVVKEIQVEQALWPVRFSPEQLEQILMNLVVNSADAMLDGGKLTIRVENSSSSHGGDHVVIHVEDTGVGVDAEELERVFEPFYTTKASRGGSGLGLPTVSAAIHRGGGRLEFDSEVGRGTQVRVFLPRADDDEPKRAPRGGDDAAEGAGERILVCEADDNLRRFMEIALRLNGYGVGAVGCGREAARRIETAAEGIDLLITDTELPHISGRELIEIARRTGSHFAILVTSGNRSDLPSDVVPAENLSFLAKPFTSQTFLHEVKRLLAVRRLVRTSPPQS